jgi:hypothetical protein
MRLTDLHEVVTGRPAGILHLAGTFPWQTIPLLSVLI